ncbi:glutathione hydrolase 1 proenzyme-like [Dermacentor variabilis]|uniref:glutathione hydrolase 1 proenzyme-like n=1 Tax=Dermacentor variabilis TaxID=34621 RepID=UPI003F5B731D
MRFPSLLLLSPEEQARRDERWRRRTRLNPVFFVLTSVGGLAVLAALWMLLPQFVIVLWPPTSNAPMGNFSSWAAVTIKECAGVPRRVFAERGTVGDAAVALTLCTCVALPIHCGLGGGVMALYYNNVTRKTWFIDGREESPSGASQSFYAATNTTETGIMSIAVPGQIRGLVKLHELTGNNLAWKKLFTEAIALAKDGFVVSQRFIDDLELYRNQIERNRELRLLFRPDQLEVGSMLQQSKMANTLTKLASDARQDYFYQKEFATEWHRELSDIGSLIKLTDILNYEARKLPTLNITLEDELMLVTAPPPTTGAITAAICGIVKQKYSDHPPNDDASFYHVLTEAFKFGFGRRSVFGDYDFTDAERTT